MREFSVPYVAYKIDPAFDPGVPSTVVTVALEWRVRPGADSHAVDFWALTAVKRRIAIAARENIVCL